MQYLYIKYLSFSLLSFISTSIAQLSTGTLRGTITDSLKNPLPLTFVTITNINTGFILGDAASEDGIYLISAIPPGVYKVVAKHLSYTSSELPEVEIQIGQSKELNFTLTIIPLDIGEVEVVGSHPTEVDRTDVSTVIREQQIEALPLNSRNFIELSALAPGVRSYPGVVPSYGAFNQYRFLNVYVDGAEWKNRFNGNTMGNVQTGVCPQGAVKEFRFMNNAFDAEYGRGGAFIVTAVTKRGGNEMHGNAFYNYRNKDWNALCTFEKTKPDFKFGQMGLSLSGPITKNKLFYAATYERFDLTNIIQTTPGKPSYDPDKFAAYNKTTEAPRVDNFWVLRFTTQLWENHINDFIWDARRIQLETGWGGLRPESSKIIGDDAVDNVLIKDRWVISGNVINEFIFQFIRWGGNTKPQLYESERRYPSIILGGNSNFPRDLGERAFKIKDNYSFNINDWGGIHNFKVGLEFTYHTVDVNYFEYYRPILFYSTDTSSIPYRAQIAVGKDDPYGTSDAHVVSNAKFFSIYFQDKWRPTSKLTLNLGIRWDGDIDALNNDFVSPLINDTAITNNIDTKYINQGDRKNNLFDIAPRLGFSYDLFGDNRTTIRGGLGLFYDRVAYIYPYYERRDLFWITYTIDNPETSDPEALRQLVLQGNGSAQPNITLMDKTLKNPVTREFSFGIGHYLTNDLVINVDYVNNNGTNYYSRYIENYYKPSINQRTITEKYGDIYIWGNFGTNFYQALLVELTKPFSDGWMLQVSYALSEARSEVDLPESGYTFLSSFKDAFSSFDERHRLTINGIIDLPLGFQVAGILNLGSPTPISAIVGMDLNNNSNFNDDWPSDERNSVRPDIKMISNWYKNIDIRIMKNFVTDYGTFRITAEAFNLFNWRNYSYYGSRMFDASGNPILNFGEGIGAFSVRQIQIGVGFSY